MPTGRRVFITVGSTRFPKLIEKVLSHAFLGALKEAGYSSVRIQYGSDEALYERLTIATKMNLSGFDYMPSLQREMEQAQLIISHAGLSF